MGNLNAVWNASSKHKTWLCVCVCVYASACLSICLNKLVQDTKTNAQLNCECTVKVILSSLLGECCEKNDQ